MHEDDGDCDPTTTTNSHAIKMIMEEREWGIVGFLLRNIIIFAAAIKVHI